MPRTRFLGTGLAVPDRVVTNEELSQEMDTSDEWIRTRTGIQERRYVREGETGVDLALAATRRALEMADVAASEVDAIVYATSTPDHFAPGNGVFLQRAMGVGTIPAIDIRTQCSGFVYALSVADGWIRTGQYRRVLVVGAEVQSTGMLMTTEERHVVRHLRRRRRRSGPGSDRPRGSGDPRVRPPLRRRPRGEALGGQSGFDVSPEGVRGAHRRGAAPPRDGRQGSLPPRGGADARIGPHGTRRHRTQAWPTSSCCSPTRPIFGSAEMMQRDLCLRDDQVYNNIMCYGNTTAATIPIALDECVRAGRVKEGDLLAMTAFGSGFLWGSAAVVW